MSCKVCLSLTDIVESGLNYLVIRCIVGIEIALNIARAVLDDCWMIIIVEEICFGKYD